MTVSCGPLSFARARNGDVEATYSMHSLCAGWRVVVAYERASAPKRVDAKELTPGEAKAAALHFAAGRRRVACAYRAAIDANAGARAGKG